MLIVTAAFLPFVFLAGGFLTFRISNARAVRKAEASIRSEGEPLTLNELGARYETVPDAENGATLLMEAWATNESRVYRFNDALPFLGSAARHVSRSGALPATNYSAAASYLTERAEHLDHIRAALRRPRFHFPLRFADGWNVRLPHQALLTEELQTFRIVSLVATERGDLVAALDAIEDMHRAARVTAEEPCLISQLARLRGYHLTLLAMERLLSRQALSADQLDRLSLLIQQMETPGVLRKVLVTERVCLLAIFDAPELLFSSATGGEEEEDSSARPTSFTGVLRATGIATADRRLLLETMAGAIALAKPDANFAPQECEQAVREAAAKANHFPPRMVSAIVLPAVEKSIVRFTLHESRRRLASIAIAVERYRLTHESKLPKQLDELTPGFLPQLPTDPFDGGTIRFKLLPTGYVIYSIGENLADDGGKEWPKKGMQRDFDETFFVER